MFVSQLLLSRSHTNLVIDTSENVRYYVTHSMCADVTFPAAVRKDLRTAIAGLRVAAARGRATRGR